MDTVFAKVAGLDVHHQFITVAVRRRLETGKPFAEVRTYGTMTRDLRAMADYPEALGVTHVALESTVVLWKPVWNILEGRFTLLLVNPRHVKQVPGRKGDLVGVGGPLGDLIRAVGVLERVAVGIRLDRRQNGLVAGDQDVILGRHQVQAATARPLLLIPTEPVPPGTPLQSGDDDG
jgi:hypothetical protein